MVPFVLWHFLKKITFWLKRPIFFTRNPTGNVPGLVEKRQFFLASNRAGNVSLVATNQKYHQKYIVFLHSWRRPHVLLKIPRFVTINTAGKCPNISSENIWFGCLEHGGEMSWWVVKKTPGFVTKNTAGNVQMSCQTHPVQWAQTLLEMPGHLVKNHPVSRPEQGWRCTVL